MECQYKTDSSSTLISTRWGKEKVNTGWIVQEGQDRDSVKKIEKCGRNKVLKSSTEKSRV